MRTKHKHWFALTASTLSLTGLSFASGFGDEKYIYDASGNVLEKQIGDQVTRYDYTGNQLVGSASDSSSKQYAYDSSGRLTSDSEAGKATRKIEHQYLDKVTKIQNGDKTTEFLYNAAGQLVATNSAGTSETFAWDGLAMVNRGEKLYVNEAHVVGGVPVIVANEVAVSDMIGTSLSVGNGSFESTAFGQGLADGLFTGKPFVQGLGGFLFKFRTYSACDVRWRSADPSGYPDGRNTYSYAKEDPINKYDRMGLLTDTFRGDINCNINEPGGTELEHIGVPKFKHKFDVTFSCDAKPTLKEGTISWDTSGDSVPAKQYQKLDSKGADWYVKSNDDEPSLNDTFKGKMKTKVDRDGDWYKCLNNTWTASTNVSITMKPKDEDAQVWTETLHKDLMDDTKEFECGEN